MITLSARPAARRPVCNAHAMIEIIQSMARSMTQWSKDHERRHHLRFAVLAIGWRLGRKECRFDGSGLNLAKPDA
jgi:hypothetical protein